LNKLYIRIQLEGELARIFEVIKEAHKLKLDDELLQTLIDDDMRFFGNTIEIPISKEGYQQIWRLIKEFDLDYSSVEEFVEETFIDMLKLSWKAFNQANTGILQKKTLAYIV
jgi:hypothetical protein